GDVVVSGPGSAQGSVQSIGAAPWAINISLALENGREPKNPLRADSGLGCTDSMHRSAPINGLSWRALLPHRMATSGFGRAASARMDCSVISSQPLPLCEFGAPGRTVSALLSSSTP